MKLLKIRKQIILDVNVINNSRPKTKLKLKICVQFNSYE